jgi:uncharacterized protein
VCADSRAMSIWSAAAAGNLADVQRLVGEDLRLLDRSETTFSLTPLLHAASKGHWEVVRWLVNRGAALNEQRFGGTTALGLASSRGCTPVVRLLLERGADPTLATDDGETPLIEASTKGYVEIVRCLLDHPNAAATVDHGNRWEGRAALSWACEKGHEGVARALLEKGADPIRADRCGFTPLIHASMGGHAETVRCLLDHPSAAATINDLFDRCGGNTLLALACEKGHVGVVRALLEKGADHTIATRSNWTPMAIAKLPPPPGLDFISAEGRRECVEALKVRCSLRPSLPSVC